MFHGKAFTTILNGLMAFTLSLIVWKLTGNFWGWLALALPGAFLLFYGWYLIFRKDND